MPFLEEYTLLEQLGQGGFASVYKVRHNKLGYIRAIRVLNTLITNGEHDTTYRKFENECKLLLRIGNGNTPNIVHIYQPKLLDHKAIVEMDYIQGCDVAHLVKDNNGFIEAHEVIKAALDISSALAYCHVDIYKYCMDRELDNLPDDPNDGSKVLIDDATRRRLINTYRVIHNDIHSGNIMRREDGSYVLLDFGLALEGDNVARKSQLDNGAPEFKAPEKWDGDDKSLTTASDIYSFGIVLYEMLAGRVPFPCEGKNKNSFESIQRVREAHNTKLPPSIFELRSQNYSRTHGGQSLDERDYPEWLEKLILKCLAKNPDDRFKDGKELHSFVERKAGEAAIRDEISVLKNENLRLSRQEAKVREKIVTVPDPTLVSKIESLEKDNKNLQFDLADAKNELTITKKKVCDLEAEVKNKNHEIEILKKKKNGGGGTTVYPGTGKEKPFRQGGGSSHFRKITDDGSDGSSVKNKEWLLPVVTGVGIAVAIFLILQWLN